VVRPFYEVLFFEAARIGSVSLGRADDAARDFFLPVRGDVGLIKPRQGIQDV
jgi:hypothetical protein